MAIKMSELKLNGGLLLTCTSGSYGTLVGCFDFGGGNFDGLTELPEPEPCGDAGIDRDVDELVAGGGGNVCCCGGGVAIGCCC